MLSWKWPFLLKSELPDPQAYKPILMMTRRALDDLYEPYFFGFYKRQLMSELLMQLWQDDIIVLLILRLILVHRDPRKLHRSLRQLLKTPKTVLTASIEAHFIEELTMWIRRQAPLCPTDAARCFEVVVEGLCACLRHNMQELRQTDESFPLDYVLDCLEISRQMNTNHLHDVHCEILVTTKQILAAERDGLRVPRLEMLQRELYDVLCRKSHEKPMLWKMLKDPATSEVFWPVIDAIGNIGITNPVPQLLDSTLR